MEIGSKFGPDIWVAGGAHGEDIVAGKRDAAAGLEVEAFNPKGIDEVPCRDVDFVFGNFAFGEYISNIPSRHVLCPGVVNCGFDRVGVSGGKTV